MTGLIQRLLDRGNSLAAAPVSVQATARSTSPMAEHDQRLQHSEYRSFPGLPAAADQNETLPMDVPRSPEMVLHKPAQRTASHLDSDTDVAKRSSSSVIKQPKQNLTAPIKNAALIDAGQPSFDQKQKNPNQRQNAKSDVAREILKEATLSPPAPDHPIVPAPLQTTPAVAPLTTAEPSTAVPPVPNEVHQSTSSAISPVEVKQPFTPTVPAIKTSLDDVDQNAAQILKPILPQTPPLPIDQMLEENTPPTVQPVQRQDPVPQPASEVTESGLEKTHIVEKTIREIQVPVEKTQTHTGPLTAHSVSKIGALPDRRRVHSLFGLRRR